MKGGAAVHVEERTEDMYASIDLLSHKLAKALRRHNEKVTDSYHKGNSKDMTVDVVDDFDEEELLVDLAEEYRR